MNLPISRQSVLIGTALLMLFIGIGYQLFFRDEGITIREKQVPLSKILAQLKKQGGIPVHSNMDPATPVTMDVEGVPLAEAMEVLSIELEARWMPYYAVAPDKSRLTQILGSLESGSGREGVKTFYRPLPGPIGWVAGDYLPDPKNLSWVRESVAGKNNLEGVLEGMAEGSEAGYVIPNDWNPAIAKLPTKNSVAKAVGQVADEARGDEYAFLYLYQRPRNPDGGPGDRPQFGGGSRSQPNEELVDKRMALRLAALPPDERGEAETDWNEQKKRWKEMQNLSPEERRARMQQLMEDPVMQEKMEEAAAKREARSTPEKRRDRYKRYADRKQQMRGSS